MKKLNAVTMIEALHNLTVPGGKIRALAAEGDAVDAELNRLKAKKSTPANDRRIKQVRAQANKIGKKMFEFARKEYQRLSK